MIPRVTWVAILALACACNPFKAEVPAVKAGVDAYEQSQFDDAAKNFDEAIREEPTSEAHFGRGATLRQQHKDAEAAEEFRRVLSTDDDELKARAYLNLGNAEARAGRMKEAIEAYARALQLAPNDADARYNLEWALREKQKPSQGSNGDGDEKSDDGSDQDEKGEKGERSDASKKDEPGEGKDDRKKDGEKDGNGEEQAPGVGQDGGDKKDANQGPKPGEQDGAGKTGEEAQARQGGEKQEQGASPGEGADRQPQPAGVAKAAPPPKSKGRQDVGQVLDALQANEKGLQMWRFQKRDETKSGGDVDQDW